MQLPELSGFSLVGGTALALKFGHRNSIDLDLFSEENFDHAALHTLLQNTFQHNLSYTGTRSKWGVFCMIEGVKVDIVYFPHKRIQPVEQRDEIRMYGDNDLMAMKVNAILRRGKKKDFWDICELLEHYSMQQMIDCYYKKFPSQMLYISIPQALTYFVDAHDSEAPVSFRGQTWESVQAFIQKKVRDFLI
jgi:predicted nucleotidyltransferase component of viral defense system